jgi:transcription elongation factor Elf1
MCPKTASHRVPHNRIKILVKEAKQMVNGPYYCPKCKKELMQILADKNKKEVLIVCTCGMEHQMVYAPVFQPIDYYSKFMDLWKKGKFFAPLPPKTNPPEPAKTEQKP